jgi:hypothetical protein
MEKDQLNVENDDPETPADHHVGNKDKSEKSRKSRKSVKKSLEVIEISDSDSETHLDKIVEEFVRIRLGHSSRPRAAPEAKGLEANQRHSGKTGSFYSKPRVSRTMSFALDTLNAPKI